MKTGLAALLALVLAFCTQSNAIITEQLTLAIPAVAEQDSFPVIVARDTLGRSSGTYEVGADITICALARNRFTGEVRVFVPADAPAEADTLLARVCERARQSYAAERAG